MLELGDIKSEHSQNSVVKNGTEFLRLYLRSGKCQLIHESALRCSAHAFLDQNRFVWVSTVCKKI